MSIETLLGGVLVAVGLWLLSFHFRYGHLFGNRGGGRSRTRRTGRRRSESSPVSFSQGNKVKTPVQPTTADEGNGLLAGLPQHLQNLVKGAVGSVGDSYTVTTVSSSSQSTYEFTDKDGKTHQYSSLDEMDPSTRSKFEQALAGGIPGGGKGGPPAVSAEDALATEPFTLYMGEKSPQKKAKKAKAAKSKPASAKGNRAEPVGAGARGRRFDYIPLDPEDPVGGDQGGGS